MIYLIYLFTAITIILVLFLLYNIVIWIIVKVPYVKVRPDRLKIIFENLKIDEDSNVYELGCGTANFLLGAEKYRPAKLVGFELSPLLYFLAKLKVKIKKSKAIIKFQNFFKADISDADIIFLFLVDKVVQDAWQKIKQETRPGTKVVVLSDQIRGVEPYKILEIDDRSKILFYDVQVD